MIPFQVAAIEAGLMTCIQKMWSWCMLDKALKISVLELLVTFTADCKKGLFDVHIQIKLTPRRTISGLLESYSFFLLCFVFLLLVLFLFSLFLSLFLFSFFLLILVVDVAVKKIDSLDA